MGRSQEFYGDVALWAKLDHPNILRCFGVTVDPPQILMKWMPNGEAMEYVREHTRVDRVSLVSSSFVAREANFNRRFRRSLSILLLAWIISTHTV